ncbi:response regulator [Pseudomonas azerbaijanoccidentalis]|jgi:two-component system capsular synthesis response regulator RcsB
MTKIKVVLADDHPVVLLGLNELIARDTRFKVVGQATNSTQLVGVLREQAPDVVITDYHMPEASIYGDGLKLISYLARNFPVVGIVVLTMISNSEIYSRLQKLGANVVQKKQMVFRLQCLLDNLAANTLVYDFEESSALEVAGGDRVQKKLNARELEVLRLFMVGMSSHDIGQDQSLSIKTVSAYKMSVMKKLGVGSDQELIGYCIRNRIFN